jgi:hypothetical protein
MARDFLMSFVEPEPLIRGNAHCKELLLEAMKYHLLPEQRSALATERTAERRPEGMRPYLFAVGACDSISTAYINIVTDNPVWRRVRIPPPQSLRFVRGDRKGTQSQMRR